MKKFMKGAAITGGIFLLLGLIVFVIGAIGGGVRDIREKYTTAVTLKDKLENSTINISEEDLEAIVEALDNSDLSELSELNELSELTELIGEEDLSELTDILEEMGITDGEDLSEIVGMFDGITFEGINISFSNNVSIISDLFDDDQKIYKNGEFTFEDITENKVELTVGAGQLKVKYHSEDVIKLDVGKNDGMQCFVEDGTIYIIGGCLKDNTDSDMTVYLPTEFLQQDNCENMSIEVAAGSLEMEGLVAKEAAVDVGMGNVIVYGLYADSLEVSVGMGNTEMTGVVNNEALVDVGMGQIVLELYGNSEDYNYTLDCGMGSLTVEDVYSIAGIGEQSINNNAEKDIEASCGMGNIEVRFE